jgi:hypothetical protein
VKALEVRAYAMRQAPALAILLPPFMRGAQRRSSPLPSFADLFSSGRLPCGLATAISEQSTPPPELSGWCYQSRRSQF